MTTFKKAFALASLACLALAMFAPAPLVAQEQSEEMKIVLAAEQLLQQQKPQEALAEAQKALDMNEEFAPAHFIRGHAFLSLSEPAEAYDSFVKAAEFNPGWGLAHRFASMAAADLGNLDESWNQAIKAHQAGTDMSDAFELMGNATTPPDDLEERLAVARVFIGPIDTETFENQADSALSGGSSSSASARTDIGRRVVSEVQGELFQLQQEARRQFSDSRMFGLVQRQDMANYIMVMEVDSISDTQRQDDNNRASQNRRRRMRGAVKIVDAQSGEEAFRRRFDFRDIASRSDVNRDFTTLMGFIEEWAVGSAR